MPTTTMSKTTETKWKLPTDHCLCSDLFNRFAANVEFGQYKESLCAHFKQHAHDYNPINCKIEWTMHSLSALVVYGRWWCEMMQLLGCYHHTHIVPDDRPTQRKYSIHSNGRDVHSLSDYQIANYHRAFFFSYSFLNLTREKKIIVHTTYIKYVQRFYLLKTGK